jgi:tight adherence protein B
MIGLVGAIVGVLASTGVWVTVCGLRGVALVEHRRVTVNGSALAKRAGAAFVAWVAIWLVTGWPMAGLIGAGLVVMVPLLAAARRERAAAVEKTDALAAWAEMLRDTIAAHAGLNQAVAATARVAPLVIRTPVQALAARAERIPLSQALTMFAAEVDDPVADLIVSALVIADERQARNLTGLLSEIAASARSQSAMRLRVETGRARTYASSQAIVVITLGLVVMLLVTSPKFLDPYDSVVGQLVMAVIGGLFIGALWGLVQLGRPVVTPRLLAGIEERSS